MSYPRIEMFKLQELVRQYRKGVPVRPRCKSVGMSSRTEAKYRKALAAAMLLEGDPEDLPSEGTLKAAVEAFYPPAERPRVASTVDPWMKEIRQKFEEGVGAKATHDYLTRRHDEFAASLSSVRRAYKRLRHERGVRAEDVAIIVDTVAGDVAQVDFGEIVRIPDANGNPQRAWVFVMVLGHSRMMYAEIVRNQDSETWLRLHINAFEYFRGVPKTVVPDNLKAAVTQAAFGMRDWHKVELNRSYVELGRHYGFLVDPTPAYAPAKKGKVESGVKYVKRNFVKSESSFASLDEANALLQQWLERTANVRIHGTTHERPVDRFEEHEMRAMQPLPAERYEPVVWARLLVHRNAHVTYRGAKYSVPWEHIGETVLVRVTAADVRVFLDTERLATHPLVGRGERSTFPVHLPAERRELAERSVDAWLERARAIGEDVHRFAQTLTGTGAVLSPLPELQRLMRTLEKYPVERAQAACRRAEFFGVARADGVQRILEHGLDRQPYDQAKVLSEPLKAPRFARTAEELLGEATEGTHGPH